MTRTSRIVGSSFANYTGKPVGPRGIDSSREDELSFFELFIDDIVVHSFITHTNAYGRVHYGSDWGRDLDDEVFYKWLAITFHIGICSPPNILLLWSKSSRFYHSNVAKLLRYKKFLKINVALHYVDVIGLSAEERTTRNRIDPFWLVTPFVDQLNRTFRQFFQFGDKGDIDEMAIKFKGRHIARCYNPNKPNKFHFKAFCLNCSRTGYLYQFFLYQGAAEVRPANTTATEWPVQKIIGGLPELYKNNMVLALDNWYTSIPIALYLLDKGIHMVGTCKTNRKLIAKDAILPTNGERGEMKSFIGTVTIDGNQWKKKIYMTGWRDNKPVLMLHTMPTEKGLVSRAKKINKKKRQAYTRVDVWRPTIIGLYNKAMGGTDAIDQRNSYYENLKRGQKWPGRIFKHFFQTSMTNAYILFKLHLGNRDLSNPTLLDFMVAVIHQLSGVYEDFHENNVQEIRAHTPIRVKNNDRRDCSMCNNRKCSYYCKECKKFACIPCETDEKKPSCFERHIYGK